MLYIYSKEKKSKLTFTVNLTAEEVKQFMGNNLFLDYPELNPNDYIVIERNEAFKYPTYDGVTNSIREMSRDELIEEDIEIQLVPGEYIENKKLKFIPQPTAYHTWNVVTHTWDINMDEVKKTFRHKFQNILLEKLFGSYEYKGNIFQMREYDEINFIRVRMALDIASEATELDTIKEALKTLEIEITSELENKIKFAIENGKLKDFLKTLPMPWRLQNNSIVELTLGNLNQLYLNWILRLINSENKYNAITLKIAKANSVYELEKIKWE